jgi:hypothetical protein
MPHPAQAHQDPNQGPDLAQRRSLPADLLLQDRSKPLNVQNGATTPVTISAN